MPFPDREPRNEDEAKARAKSPDIEVNILLEFHGMEEYGPYIRIEDGYDGPSYRIESDGDHPKYMASVWLSPVYPKTYWIATVTVPTTNAQGETATFHEHPFDTRHNALLYVLKQLRDNGFAPHCEWTEWKDTGNGVQERECLLCPKMEVRHLEDLEDEE